MYILRTDRRQAQLNARYHVSYGVRNRFPAANVRRLQEWVSTDTIFFDVPAHDDGIPPWWMHYGTALWWP